MKKLFVVMIVTGLLGACAGQGTANPDSSDSLQPLENSKPGEQQRQLQWREVGQFSQPVVVTAPSNNKELLFVAEKGGRIRLVRNNTVVEEPFLDLSDKVSSGYEQGLLGLAFAPDYARSGLFYINYTDRAGETQVVEYRRAAGPAGERADPNSARVVLSQAQPEENHNGGSLVFGPDRFLYLGFGDGGGGGDEHGLRGNAQNKETLLGKLLRIDPRRAGARPYSVPQDNPFVARPGRDEIFAYGLRNPWRFSFDPESNSITIADVGQSVEEEANWLPLATARGGNFGWRIWEGNFRYREDETARGHLSPALSYTREGGECSVTGGYVLRDPQLPAQARGRYVYGDFCTGAVRTFRLGRNGKAVDDRPLLQAKVEQLSTFGEDGQRRLYAASLAGTLYRLQASE